ncbi:MAG TPA: hypothetical protein VF111_02520 [Thermoanaerobaculia bacterium]
MNEVDFQRLLDAQTERVENRLDEIKQLFATTTAEIRQSFATTTAEIRQSFTMTTDEIRQLFTTTTAEIKHEFAITTEDNRHQIQLIAEQLLTLNEKIDQKADAEEMRRGFADLEALFRYGHEDHERRLRALESTRGN